MAADLFRAEVGFEISDVGVGSLVQILTGTAPPNATPTSGNPGSPQDAPVGSLWIVNAGSASTTRVYQKFRDLTNDNFDWRDITSSISWLEPAKVADTSTWANVAAAETELNGTTTNGPLKTAQTQANYDGLGGNGTFVGGDGAGGTTYAPGDVITLSNGATITVATIDVNGDVATFSVTTAGTPVNAGVTLTQTSVAPPGGLAFTLTPQGPNLQSQLGGLDTPGTFVNGDRILLTDLTTGTEGIYIVTGTPGSGATLTLDPTNPPTDGDAIIINEGTYADDAYLYNGTQWVAFGSGSAAEESNIRAFIGKDTTSAEKPDYRSPSTGFDTPQIDEDPGRTPYTDATSANGYVIARYDNLELAIAKLNQEFFQNNRHLYATGVTTLADTVPTWIDGCKWMVRVDDGAGRIRQYEVHATTDGTNVDYTSYALVRLGTAITGLTITVTVAGGSLVLTASTTNNCTFEIRRMGTVGVPANAGRALSV